MSRFDDYKSKIDLILTNPDTALAEIGSVYDELSTDLTSLESITAENESLKSTINDLRETNIKLYMQSTGEATEMSGTEDEDTDEKAVDEFFDELMKGE